MVPLLLIALVDDASKTCPTRWARKFVLDGHVACQWHGERRSRPNRIESLKRQDQMNGLALLFALANKALYLWRCDLRCSLAQVLSKLGYHLCQQDGVAGPMDRMRLAAGSRYQRPKCMMYRCCRRTLLQSRQERSRQSLKFDVGQRSCSYVIRARSEEYRNLLEGELDDWASSFHLDWSSATFSSKLDWLFCFHALAASIAACFLIMALVIGIPALWLSWNQSERAHWVSRRCVGSREASCEVKVVWSLATENSWK